VGKERPFTESGLRTGREGSGEAGQETGMQAHCRCHFVGGDKQSGCHVILIHGLIRGDKIQKDKAHAVQFNGARSRCGLPFRSLDVNLILSNYAINSKYISIRVRKFGRGLGRVCCGRMLQHLYFLHMINKNICDSCSKLAPKTSSKTNPGLPPIRQRKTPRGREAIYSAGRIELKAPECGPSTLRFCLHLIK
jgi:hypothetical protein